VLLTIGTIRDDSESITYKVCEIILHLLVMG
jgi:hypothetical protein